MIDVMLTWLLTYLVHSSLFLGTAWLIDRALRQPPWAELLWRCALFGGLLTASVPPVMQAVQATPWDFDRVVAAQPAVLVNDVTTKSSHATRALAPISVERETMKDVAVEPVSISTVKPMVQSLRLPEESGHIVAALGLVWLLVAAVGLVRLAWQWLQLRRAIQYLPQCLDVRWLTAASCIAQRLGLPTPRLLISTQWDSPLLGPNNTVCIPQWCVAELDASQIEAVLAHEMAHQQRGDIAWRLVMVGAARLGWLQPLNQLALKRLDMLAEHACDEAALRTTHNRVALAEALYACARALQSRARPVLALSMAATKPSPLLQRVQHLLKESPMKLNFRPRYLGWAALGLLTVCAFILPPVVLDGRPLSSIDWSDEFTFGTGPVKRMVSKTSEGRVEIMVRGKVEFANDGDAVKSVDQRLMLEEFRDGQVQRITFTPGVNGALEKRYTLNGKDALMDQKAQQWLQRHMPLLIKTVLGGDAYVQRLLAHGGVDAALLAIETGKPSHLQPELVDALTRLGPLSDENQKRLLVAINAIGNDYEKSQTLRSVAAHQQLGSARKIQWLQTAAKLGNDYERQQALTAFIPFLGKDADALEAWHLALRGIGSDYERHNVLLALLKVSTLDTPGSLAMLGSLAGMKASYEQTNVILALAPKLAPNAEVLEQVQLLARKLPTHERGQVEQALDGLREKVQAAEKA